MLKLRKKNRQFTILDFYQEDLWGRLRARDFKKFKLTKFNAFIYKKAEQSLLTEYINQLKNKSNIYKNNFFNKIRHRKLIPNRKWFLNGVVAPKNPQHKKVILETRRRLKLDLIVASTQKFSYQTMLDKPQRKRRKLSRFAFRLKQRHKLRKFASFMNVRQFRNYIKKAKKKSSFILSFFRMFEGRLDVFLHRLNFMETPGQGKQLINHGNFLVNGKVIVFPNHFLNFYDVVTVKDKTLGFEKLYNLFGYGMVILNIPKYIEINYRILSAIMYRTPTLKKLKYPSRIKSAYIASAGSRFN